MPVPRSVSASQLARGEGVEAQEEGRQEVTQRPHTLDRFIKPSDMSGHAEPRRKRPFMSFRLSKKPPKVKDDAKGTISENSACESVTDGGSDSSSSASVKPKKKYLTRMSSFVSRVASKVGGEGAPAGKKGNAKLERSKTISVSDLRSHKAEDCVEFEAGKVPGVVGIRNHGNTCFINAVVQCLAHTDVLAQYFVLDGYKHDLARANKINSKKYGTRGEMTGQLALVLKALWSLRYGPDVSMNFKNTVDKHESIYRGSQQHDAAEFLMFVLDKVHEDLNTASKRKYKKIKNTYGRPDEVVAAETLANHLRCNSSFIHEIFQAQFRSSLKCPHCNKESNTFDPFLCVSIPIPQRDMHTLFVTVVYLNQQPKQVQLGLSLESSATIRELRHQVAEDCGISSDNLILTEVDGEGFHRTFTDGTSVGVIGEGDPLYAVELPPQRAPSPDSGAFVLITWLNVVLADPDNIRFGGVYQSQVVRDVTYVDLQKLLLKEMTNMVTTETLTSEQESGLFLIGVDDGGSCVVCLDPALDVPLFHESVEQALALCQPHAGPPHIKLVLQWTTETKEKYIVDPVDHMDVHSSVKALREDPTHCQSVSLHQCLQLHTSAEKLGCGDAWHCPTCNRKQQVVKRLMLWSAPQILVIHLKRFRQGTLQSNSSKLSTTVKFPLSGFDISDHVAHRSTNGQNGVDVLGGVWSPWKRPKRFAPYHEDNVYDLYAVCNHHGKDMQGGHYTAMCKNSADNKWYNFDDSKVEGTTEEDVVTADAYILFYQRRSESQSVVGGGEGRSVHWAFRIPLAYLPSNLIPQTLADKKAPPPFERGRSYGTLPVNTKAPRQSSTEREHASDTEAPLASHDESPILKRRSTHTLHEDDDSPRNESPKSNLKIETVKVEVLENGESPMECENGGASDVDQEMTEVRRNSTGKTVLISRCQALTDQDLDKEPKENKVMVNGQSDKDKNDSTEDINHHVPSKPLENGIEPSTNIEVEEETPEVRIHPATPEVLAAHHSQPKRSVITLTLRPRNPSESSGGATPEPRVRVVSRTPSMVSSCSTSSNNSNVNGSTSNGVEYIYQNGTTDAADKHKSHGDSVTPEVRITPLPKNIETPNSLPLRVSTRSTNTNKTPSYVVINTPTASPRAPRPKTPVSNGVGTSPRQPYAPKYPSSKPKETSPPEPYKPQKAAAANRKENGVYSRQAIVNGKNSNHVPSVSYCTPMKNNLGGGTGLKHSRFDRIDKYDSINDKSEFNGKREDRYMNEERYVNEKSEYNGKREERYHRERSFERSEKERRFDRALMKGEYERESRYERDYKYENDSMDRDYAYDNDLRYDRCDRDNRYERDYMYDRESRYDRDYKYDRELKCEKDVLYDREPHYDRDFKCSRDLKCSRDFSYEREHLYERDLKHERDYRYDRDMGYDYKYDDARYDREFSKYEREDSKYRDEYRYERGEVNGRRSGCKTPEHCGGSEYAKGHTNTATTPPVITESSV